MIYRKQVLMAIPCAATQFVGRTADFVVMEFSDSFYPLPQVKYQLIATINRVGAGSITRCP
jgi:hypothetical protein